MKLTDDPYFKAAAFVGSDLQLAYVDHVRAELHRIHPGAHGFANQRAGRIWRSMIQQGLIAASLSFESVSQ